MTEVISNIDFNVESEVVSHIVLKQRRERVLYLLNNPKKRRRILVDMEKYLDFSKFQRIDSKVNQNDVFDSLARKSQNKDPYLMCYEITTHISLHRLEAIDVLNYGEVLIYFGNGIGYWQAHDKEGTRERYIFVNKPN